MNALSKGKSAATKQHHLLLIQDISGVGRCASMVALPVLSLAGIHCSLWPTMLLSTHTGGFGKVYRRDLFTDMQGMLAHWLQLGLQFDSVYLGYVGGAAQLQLVEDALSKLHAPGGTLYVDPAMGDQGHAYAYCGPELISGYRRLCARADVIFPNRTEAAMLLDLPLTPGTEPEPPSPHHLLALGAKAVVLTGVAKAEQVGVQFAKGSETPGATYRKRYPGSFPGTGDLLASAIIAALSKGASLATACELACDFLDNSLAFTAAYHSQSRFGLAFEPALPGFCQALMGTNG